MEDPDQLEQWFRAYSQDIYQFLIYYTGRIDVDDLVQDVFIKAYQSRSSFKGFSQPKTWLMSIARNIAIDHARKNKRFKELIPTLFKEHEQLIETPDQVLTDKEAIAEFYQTTLKLKRNDQDVLLCRLLNDMSVSETAEVLGWSKAKVNLTYHRALKKLKNLYAFNLEED